MVKIMENPINPWMIWGETHYSWKYPFFALQMLAEGTIVMVNKGIVQAVVLTVCFFP